MSQVIIDAIGNGLTWVGLCALLLIAAACVYVGLCRVSNALWVRLSPAAIGVFAVAAVIATCEAQKRSGAMGTSRPTAALVGRVVLNAPLTFPHERTVNDVTVHLDGPRSGWLWHPAEVSVAPSWLPHFFPDGSAELTATVSNCHSNAYLGCTWTGGAGITFSHPHSLTTDVTYNPDEPDNRATNGIDLITQFVDYALTNRVTSETVFPLAVTNDVSYTENYTIYMSCPKLGTGTITATFTPSGGGDPQTNSVTFRCIEPLRRFVNSKRDVTFPLIMNPSRLVYGTNALPYMRRLVLNLTLPGWERRDEIGRLIRFSPVNDETTTTIETIFTNRVDFTWKDREKCFDYASKVVAASQLNLVSQSVCDRAARVFTHEPTEWQLFGEYDYFWERYYPGYAMSSNRLQFVNNALTNTNLTQDSDW